MRQHISLLFAQAALALAGVFALAILVNPQPALAVNFFGDACNGAGSGAAACSGSGADNISGTDGIILRAAALISIVAGIAAVIVIMIAGIMFITAAGDSGKISTAKNTITYAVVGLVVIVLARAIVVFVVSNV